MFLHSKMPNSEPIWYREHEQRAHFHRIFADFSRERRRVTIREIKGGELTQIVGLEVMIARVMRGVMTQGNIAHRGGRFLMLQSLRGHRDPDRNTAGSCVRHHDPWKTDTRRSYKFFPTSIFARGAAFRARRPAINAKWKTVTRIRCVRNMRTSSSDKSRGSKLKFERLRPRYFTVAAQKGPCHRETNNAPIFFSFLSFLWLPSSAGNANSPRFEAIRRINTF